jgi:hypothetical protein
LRPTAAKKIKKSTDKSKSSGKNSGKSSAKSSGKTGKSGNFGDQGKGPKKKRKL